MAKTYFYGYNEDDLNQSGNFRINETYYVKGSLTFVYQPLLIQVLKDEKVILQALYTEIYLNRVLATGKQQIETFINTYFFVNDDGNKGDISVSNNGETWEINEGVVDNTKLAVMPAMTLKGNNTSSEGPATDIPISDISTGGSGNGYFPHGW